MSSDGTSDVATLNIKAFLSSKRNSERWNHVKASRGLRSVLAQMAGTDLSEPLSATRKRRMHKSQEHHYSWIARGAPRVYRTELVV